MEDNIVEESARGEEQLLLDFSEIKSCDFFVALDDEEQSDVECADVDDVLQNVIASLRASNDAAKDDDIQC